MKKAISVLIIASMLFSAFASVLSAADPKTVFNDLKNRIKENGSYYEEGKYYALTASMGEVYFGIYYFTPDKSIEFCFFDDESELTLTLNQDEISSAVSGNTKTTYLAYIMYYNYDTIGEVEVNPSTYNGESFSKFSTFEGNQSLSSSMLQGFNNIFPVLIEYVRAVLYYLNNKYTLKDIGFKKFNKCSDHLYDDGKVTKKATCCSHGTKTYTCVFCGSTKTESLPFDSLAHSYDNGTVTKSPSCEEKGEKEYVCKLCGRKKYESLDPLGHAWKLTETLETDDGAGHNYALWTCSRCSGTLVSIKCASVAFSDVDISFWAHDAIDWAYFHPNQITTGTSDTKFSPSSSCTRAQIVTFLWRAAGEPEPTSTNTDFKDVKPGSYYEKAVSWAVENGITVGLTDTQFGPDKKCTRAQVATFLYRAVGSPEVGAPEQSFEDVETGMWYYTPIMWALENKITNGTSDTKFSPSSSCTRAQIVTFLYRTYKDS